MCILNLFLMITVTFLWISLENIWKCSLDQPVLSFMDKASSLKDNVFLTISKVKVVLIRHWFRLYVSTCGSLCYSALHKTSSYGQRNCCMWFRYSVDFITIIVHVVVVVFAISIINVCLMVCLSQRYKRWKRSTGTGI